jgi:hypothetical protein
MTWEHISKHFTFHFQIHNWYMKCLCDKKELMPLHKMKKEGIDPNRLQYQRSLIQRRRPSPTTNPEGRRNAQAIRPLGRPLHRHRGGQPIHVSPPMGRRAGRAQPMKRGTFAAILSVE